MTDSGNEYSSVARVALASSNVERNLGRGPAVVLERIARGGGATRWYLCRDADELRSLEERLSPGSVVSFFFDDRIRRAPFSDLVEAEVAQFIGSTGDAVVGVLEPGGVVIGMEVILGPADLAETAPELRGKEVFYGESPGRDDDGIRAVTITLPDRDGVVRDHPH